MKLDPYDNLPPGLHDDPIKENRPCLSPSHNAPNLMYIPAGKVYVHVCPSCGQRTVVRGGASFTM